MECTDNILKTKTLTNGDSKEILMIHLKCPQPYCWQKIKYVEKNKGYTNPYAHLVKCYSCEDELAKAWFEAETMSNVHGGI